MHKTKIFFFIFALLFPVIVFGALQANSEIIETKDGKTEIKTTISGLDKDQTAKLLVGFSVKGTDDNPFSIGIKEIKESDLKNGQITYYVNNEYPGQIFQVHNKIKLSSAQTKGSAVKFFLNQSSLSFNSAEFTVDYSELREKTIWKAGIKCDQEYGENRDIDREYYFEKQGDSLYLFELDKNGNRNKIYEASSSQKNDFFQDYKIKLSFLGMKTGEQYRCLGYAVAGAFLGSSTEWSPYVRFKVPNLEAYIENVCSVDDSTIDVLVSYFYYDLKNTKPTVYLKYKINQTGAYWKKTTDYSLPNIPASNPKQCDVRKPYQVKIRLSNLQPGNKYYIAPMALIPEVQNSQIEWETIKANGMKYLADGTNGFYPREINTGGMEIKNLEPKIYNLGKSTMNKCAPYVSLRGEALDSKTVKTDFYYWFQIIDQEGNVFCTQAKRAKGGTRLFAYDVSACDPDFQLFKCSSVDQAPSSQKVRFRWVPNRKYQVMAMAKQVNANPIVFSDSDFVVYTWKMSIPNGIPEVGAQVKDRENSVKLFGYYTRGNDVYKGTFRITDVSTGISYITPPDGTRVEASSGSKGVFSYTLSFGKKQMLDSQGENTVSFEMKPNARYQVSALVYNLAGLKESGNMQFTSPNKIIYSTNLPAKINYVSQIGSVDGRYSAYGCFDASLIMVLDYWVRIHKPAYNSWYQNNDSGPTPGYCYFNTLDVAQRSGFKVIEINTNNPEYLEANFLRRGIPLIFYCVPSHNTGVGFHGIGNSDHYSVLTGFNSGSNIYERSGYKYLNNIHIFDPARGEDNLNIQSRIRELGISSLRCGYQFGQSFEYGIPSLLYSGLFAVVPNDVANTINDDQYIIKH
ncbi:MAG TPA: hypothetical protein PKL98_02565 [Candidatus Pacearchaeota archaeon]|nr:hypothetical protein [Candidatus Pacearchaeota archaeon]